MKIDIVAVTRRLVRRGSENPLGAEAAVAAVLVEQAGGWNLSVITQQVGPDRANISTPCPLRRADGTHDTDVLDGTRGAGGGRADGA